MSFFLSLCIHVCTDLFPVGVAPWSRSELPNRRAAKHVEFSEKHPYASHWCPHTEKLQVNCILCICSMYVCVNKSMSYDIIIVDRAYLYIKYLLLVESSIILTPCILRKIWWQKFDRRLFQTKSNVKIYVQRHKSSTLTVSMIEPAFRPISLASLYLCLFIKAQCPWTGRALICSARRKCGVDMPEVLLIRDRWIDIPEGYYILKLKVTR